MEDPMAETPSTMLPLGTKAPPFRLPDPQGKMVSSDDFKNAPALLVAFICNHCPFVKHIRSKFAELAKEYQARGVAIVGINSNDIVFSPNDSPDKMAEEVKQIGYVFPYLFDESQEVAKAYRAACTPDLYVFDRDRALVYRGQFDDSRPGNGRPVTGADLRTALDAVLTGQSVSKNQKPSIGCNIKWKSGNAPDYF
jgi:peroxiredoxin